jgi:hypothetical protein
MTRLFLTVSLAALVAACGQPAAEDAPEADAPEVEAPDAEAPAEDAPEETEEEEAAPPPGNDIWIADLSWTDGAPTLSNLQNLTARTGYDNQPAFTPDGGTMLYTSGDNETGQTDIWRLDLASGEAAQVTDTPDESEYSPRIAPNGRMSYIYQPPGGYGGYVYLAQTDNSDRGPAFDAQPFGYYLFNPEMDRVVTFALTDPLTLAFTDLRGDEPVASVLSENPGRALARSASGQTGAWLTLSQEDGPAMVYAFDFDFDVLTPVGALPGQAQDFAVIDRGEGDEFFSTDEGVLVFGSLSKAGFAWAPVFDLGESGLTGVTRLAVSPDNSRIAIVAEDPAE